MLVLAFLCNELHISPKLLFTIGHDCPVLVDKHGSDKNFTTLPDPLFGAKFQISKLDNNFVSFRYFNLSFACKQKYNRYETYQMGFLFEGLGLRSIAGLRGWGRGQNSTFFRIWSCCI